MHYQDRLIDLLDRKFKLVNKLPVPDFLLEIGSFVDFILQQESLEAYASQIVHQFQCRHDDYLREMDDIKLALIQLRHDLTKQFPEWAEKSFDASTLAHFDVLISEEFISFQVFGEQQDAYDPPPDISQLIDILHAKIAQLEPTQNTKKFKFSIDRLNQRLLHLHRGYTNFYLVSPGYSFRQLQSLVETIKRSPPSYLPPSELLMDWVDNRITGHSYPREQESLNDYDNQVKCAKVLLSRAYEGIRAAIGSHLIHYEILRRYKARCMWYDQERLMDLIKNNQGREEHILTRHLALYLFDNGISTLYRVSKGQHEYDLIGDQTKARIFVEAKVYRSSKHARGNLTNGIAQLHSYINALEGETCPVQEIYYVIYRLGGPLYDLPEEIPTNRRIFYPITIDLGPSSESGRRQPKPILIPPSDFFAEME